ncbi:hypothetical protein FPZ12_016205 [Amycolatopsis acidicola]|uniref:Glucose-methanol-choline oxidoreductase C-terminal domain-containing protein n=1 Tax=Amycolatopsis acidicola TaxID=2596893 RepID=A0A5N0V6K1_9PSEU|nr:GMC oxidoreductase [Amycolatopsis acidicola]KAA9160690.1 hypothetical protein FPZ12_016205 [Amycolatopsis acidicola]
MVDLPEARLADHRGPVRPEVLIVGSGPIGSAFARVVADLRPATEILMVDAGPVVTTPPGMHVKNIPGERERLVAQVRSQGPSWSEADIARAAALIGKPPSGADPRPGTGYLDPEAAAVADPRFAVAAALSTVVGGMGAHWTCACPYPAGRELPPFVPGKEWEPALHRARELLAVTQEAFPPTLQGEAVRRALSGEFDAGLPDGRKVQPMPLACTVLPGGARRWTGADTVLGTLPTDPAASFTLLPETLCRGLVVEEGRVRYAVLEDRATGGRWTVSPDLVLVAADGLRTPQLLWASGIRPKALGHYLNDHIQVMAGVQLDPALVSAVAAERSLNGHPGGRQTEDALVGVHWIPYSDEHPFHGQLMHLDLSPMPLGEGPVRDQRHVIGMGHFVPKDIRFDDRLVFSEAETDEYGMPRIRWRYELTEADLAGIEGAKHLQGRVARALGGFAAGREPSLMPNGSSLHYQGTYRMGARDDGASVCDRHARVWGLENLFLGGNGLIPTATAGNPTLTSVAHAVRTARAAVDRLAAARPMTVDG